MPLSASGQNGLRVASSEPRKAEPATFQRDHTPTWLKVYLVLSIFSCIRCSLLKVTLGAVQGLPIRQI